MFAKYVDGVEDSRDISGVSRFISGGIGGITSQLGKCPLHQYGWVHSHMCWVQLYTPLRL